jgi:tRNA threonylcarbamoyladenosine biosynthesis protein TsaB
VLLLCLDTATPSVGVALTRDGVALAGETVVDARRHGELLAVGIDAVLKRAGVSPADLGAVAAGAGPGPFTGLRVGLMTARALGHALGIPVLGVCTLDVLAHEAARAIDGEFVVASDARRKEVYWARYRAEGGVVAARLDGPAVDRPADVAYAGPVVGLGAQLHPAAFPDAREPVYPSAAELGAFVAAGGATLPPDPLYLRRPDAVEPGARKRVTT